MMKALIKVWYTCFASSILAANLAIGDQGIDKEQAQAVVGSIFDRLDCESAGTIDSAEVDDHFSQVWLPADRDRSRTLTKMEYSQIHLPVSKASGKLLFLDADANADGQIQASELRLHLQRMIKTLDADGNHEVSRKEAGLKPHPSPKPHTHEHTASNSKDS
jgi:hypothetical protein